MVAALVALPVPYVVPGPVEEGVDVLRGASKQHGSREVASIRGANSKAQKNTSPEACADSASNQHTQGCEPWCATISARHAHA